MTTMRNKLSNALFAVGLTCIVAGATLGASAAASFPGGNGRVLFDSTRGGAVNVYSVDPTNNALVSQTTSSDNVDDTPFGSPNGQKVVFRSTRSGGNNDGKIWIANALNNLGPGNPPDGATALTNSAGDDKDASFATDIEVVYSHLVGTTYQLYVVQTALPFTGTPLFTTPTGCDDTQAVANPVNANVIAFTRTCTASNSHVFTFDRSTPGTPPLDLTAANVVSSNGLYSIDTDAEADWNPSGTRLAVTGRKVGVYGGKSQIYTIAANGTDRRPLWGYAQGAAWAGTGANDTFASFSPDGTRIVFNRQLPSTGVDVFLPDDYIVTMGTTTATNAGVSLTPSRGPDLHPSWLPVVAPPNDVPETPLVVLLPLTGLLLGGFGLMLRRCANTAA